MRFFTLLRGNPHFATFTVVTTLGVGPPALYAYIYGPTKEEKAVRTAERDPDPVASRVRAKQFAKLIAAKDTQELEAVYDGLLRGGASSPAKRKHAVYGQLGELEKTSQDTALARVYGVHLTTPPVAPAPEADPQARTVTPQ